MTSKLLSIALAVACLPVISGCHNAGEVKFDIEPAVVSACNLPTAVKVHWDVSGLGLHYARLEVNNLGRPPKLWMVGEQRGVEETGAWAHDGFTVILSSMNGVELGRRTLVTTPCPDAPWL